MNWGILLHGAVLALGLAAPALAAPPSPPPRPSPPGLGLLEAVRITLESDPVIKRQEQAVEAAQGRILVASGQFDTVPSAEVKYRHDTVPAARAERLLYGAAGLAGDTVTYQAGVERQFRSGILVTPSVGMIRNDNNYAGGSVPHLATVNLNVTIPLLRGFGERAVAAAETAAKFEYEASVRDLWHTLSNSIATTANAYWNYRAALRAFAALADSETRLRKLLQDGEKLAAADMVAPADLKQYEAQAASATAARIGAEQAVLETRQALGLAMGVPAADIARLPEPADNFPAIDERPLDPAAIDAFIDQGLQRRNDLKAAEQRQEAAESLLAAADNSRLPQVDLSLDVGYQGLAEGGQASHLVTGFANRVEGVNAGASLRYRWPWNNWTAQGNVAQSQANVRDIAIAKENLARAIRSEVLVAANNITNSRLRLRQAISARQALEIAFANEKKKQQLDMSTPIDVLFIQSLLTSAAIDEVNAYAGYAASLVRLRFATATLFTPTADALDLAPRQLTTLPNP